MQGRRKPRSANPKGACSRRSTTQRGNAKLRCSTLRQAEAKLLTAEAEAQAIRKIAQAVEGSGANPAQYLIAVRYLETLKEMTSGQNNKTVYLPYEASGVLSSLGGIKELLK